MIIFLLSAFRRQSYLIHHAYLKKAATRTQNLFSKLMKTHSRKVKKSLITYSVLWGINLPFKNTTPSFSPSPLLDLQLIQAPLFKQFPPTSRFFVNPLKIGFFSEPHKTPVAPLKKVTHLFFPSKTPLKIVILPSPPF